MAADRGVRVYAIGLGTVDGAVPAYDSWTAIYMKLDEPSLRAVAQKTQAEYYYAGDAEALKNVYTQLSSRVQVEKKETELSALLALMAACLSIAAAALSLLWFRRIA
jgi:Ca-activated chloride channel family protein